jgi:hypothetical protein
MVRGTLILTALMVATLEPVIGDPDPMRYLVNQGGAWVVVAVMLYFYRRDMHRWASKDEEKVSILTTLVEKDTAASSRVAAAIEANEKAQHRVARALERMEARS